MSSLFNKIVDQRNPKVWLVLSSVIVLLIAFFWLNSQGGGGYTVALVEQGDLVEEIQASGKIEFPGKVNLHFKSVGNLALLPVRIGQKVMTGDLLAKLETTQLDSLAGEMQSAINLQKARLQQLLAGSSLQDIRVVEAQVMSASVILTSAEKSLNNTLQNATNVIKDSYIKADDAIRNNVDQMFKNAQTSTPELIFSSITDAQVEGDIESTRLHIENILKSWDTSALSILTPEELTSALRTAKFNLSAVGKFLDKMALLINNPNNKPASISQITWDSWRAGIAGARTSISGGLLTISSIEETISLKESSVNTAQANLRTTKEQLILKKSPTRATDTAVYQAQIEQAKAALWKVQSERKDLVLTSPVNGIVTETNGEKGEIITPDITVVSVLADGTPEIMLNIIEDSIVNIRVGQPVRITLDALPEKELYGKVASIDPAETKISGAVYYRAKIVFSTVEEFLRSGMTANVWIETASKSDVVYVPVSAIYKKDDKKFVRILQKATIREIEVTTGIKNSEGKIEILSGGVQKGDQLVLQQK